MQDVGIFSHYCVSIVKTYSTQLTTFLCPWDILITSWLFTAGCSTWPGKYLVPCVAELVGSCIPIHARRCLPDPKCLFYPSGLSLCLSVDHFCLVPAGDMVLFHDMVCNGWLVSYTALPCPGGSGLCTSPLLSCVPWSSDQTSCLSLQHMSCSSSCRWFPGHVLHQAVNSRDVIKMSDVHRSVINR